MFESDGVVMFCDRGLTQLNRIEKASYCLFDASMYASYKWKSEKNQ